MKKTIPFLIILLILTLPIFSQKDNTFVFSQGNSKLTVNVIIPDTVDFETPFEIYFDCVEKNGNSTYKGHVTRRTLPSGIGNTNLQLDKTTFHGIDFTVPKIPIYVRVDKKYDKELEAAYSFMEKQNVKLDTCQLQMTSCNEYMTLFNDYQRNISVLVANRDYHSNMSTPVLFWSTESSMYQLKDVNKIISYFQNQLTALGKGSKAIQQENSNKAYIAKNNAVAPILGDIRYNQQEPYNMLCPVIKGKKTLVGCVPIACAQVMAHYKYPSRGMGEYKYLSRDKKRALSKDFKKVKMDWSKHFMSDYTLPCDSLSKQYISQLVTAISGSLGAEFGHESTSASTTDIKSSLVNFWGFDTSCRLCQSNSNDTIVGLIKRDIDAGRPVIVSSNSHCFIADGYMDDYIHYNLGWGGSTNGYYLSKICNADNNSYPIKTVVIGIKPTTGKSMTLSLNVEKPNTLSTLLTKSQKLNVTSLTLTGTLGNKDVRLLRQMLGGDDPEDLFLPTGRLYDLDISGVQFKTDTNGSYYSEIAHGNAGSSWHNTPDGKSDVTYYDFDKMDSKSWASFKSVGMDKRDGEYIKFENDICTRYYHVESDNISPMMFLKCENLRRIRIPSKTKQIGHNAFNQCTSLTDIILPEEVNDVKDYAFSYTRLLKEVTTAAPIKNFSPKAFEGGFYKAVLRDINAK